MLPENRIVTHPGEILKEEFLDPLGITQSAFAAHIGVPLQQVNEIVQGKRGVTPETAWIFSQALGTTPQFWLNLQSAYEAAAKIAVYTRKYGCEYSSFKRAIQTNAEFLGQIEPQNPFWEQDAMEWEYWLAEQQAWRDQNE